MYAYHYNDLDKKYRQLELIGSAELDVLQKHAPLETWLAYCCIRSLVAPGKVRFYDFGNLLPDFRSVRVGQYSLWPGLWSEFSSDLLSYIYSEFDSSFTFLTHNYSWDVVRDLYMARILRYVQSRPDRLSKPSHKHFAGLLFYNAWFHLPLAPDEYMPGMSLLTTDDYVTILNDITPNVVSWSKWFNFVVGKPDVHDALVDFYLSMVSTSRLTMVATLDVYDNPKEAARFKAAVQNWLRSYGASDYRGLVAGVFKLVKGDPLDKSHIIALGNYASNARNVDPRLYTEFLMQLEKSQYSNVAGAILHTKYKEFADMGLIYVNLYKIVG